jgi:hypothetical protein
VTIIKATSVSYDHEARTVFINGSHVASVETMKSEHVPAAKSRVHLSTGETLFLSNEAAAVIAALWGSAAASEVSS